ncbi:hypothetical protein SRB17_81060 [Streptomyces sp. RB17]|nr:hypothetical protein [Streptomyces sp. RB17]
MRAVSGYVAQSGGADPRITVREELAAVREELVTQGRMYRLAKGEATARAEGRRGRSASPGSSTGRPAHSPAVSGVGWTSRWHSHTVDRGTVAAEGTPSALKCGAAARSTPPSRTPSSPSPTAGPPRPTPYLLFGPLINMVSMPSMLLSGLMFPMSLAPAWLNVLPASPSPSPSASRRRR